MLPLQVSRVDGELPRVLVDESGVGLLDRESEGSYPLHIHATLPGNHLYKD